MFESGCLRVDLAVAVVIGLLCVEMYSGKQVPSDVSRVDSGRTTRDIVHAMNNTTTTTDKVKLLPDIYTEWSEWRNCTRGCQQSRVRKCKEPSNCQGSWLKEKRTCRGEGKCQNKSNRTYKLLGFRKSDQLMEEILYKLLYGPWTPWEPCSRTCKKRRKRKCMLKPMCGLSYIQEQRICRKSRAMCRKHYTLNTNERTGPYRSGKPIHEKTKPNKHKYGSGTATRKSYGVGKISPEVRNATLQCGIRPPRLRGSLRIVGGREVRRHSWPWQVAILEKWKEQFCGGTLIAPQWVLTAAHCVRKKKRKRKLFVRIGEHDIYTHDKGEEDIKIVKHIHHPKYDFDTITNDIALLKLEKPVTASDKVGFACLPGKQDRIRDNTTCFILGWGKEKNTHVFGSTVLKEAQVPIVNRKKCQQVFDYSIHSTQVCAGYRSGGHDSCAGDSGGPLLCPKTDSTGVTHWLVYGVTSYGEGCAEQGKFGIYTKVRKYLKWIKSTTESY